MELVDAVVEAMERFNDWFGGARVVRAEDGYEAIPGAYLNDASYQGSREVVFVIEDIGDIAPEGTLADLGDLREYAEWMIAQEWVRP